MKTVIYLDVLLLVDFVIGYFLLRAAGMLTGTPLHFSRALLGGAGAALSSLILLAPPLPMSMQIGYQLLTALIIARVAFGWRSWATLLRQTLWYGLLNLLVAGLVLLAIQRWGVAALHTNNLAVYFNLSPLTLLLAVLSVYLCIRLGVLLFGEPPPTQGWNLCLELPSKQLAVNACLDTGFLVQDPLTGGPVVLVSLPGVQARLPQTLSEFLNAYFAGIEPADVSFSVRLVPCRTVTGQQVLPGVEVRKLRLVRDRQKLEACRVTVAFTQQSLAAGEYDALFGRDLLAHCTKQKKEGCVG